jgi:hypothetical protein
MGITKSDMITNAQALPQSISRDKTGNINVILDKVVVASGGVDNADDNIYLGLIPTNAVILDVMFLNDDLDTDGSPALAANVGLVYTGIGSGQKDKAFGDAADVDCFGTAVTLFQAPNTSWASLRFEADDIVDVTKAAWEVAGLASDPGGYFAVVLDVTTAAAAGGAGDIVMKVEYL